jgi:hypothetical protein
VDVSPPLATAGVTRRSFGPATWVIEELLGSTHPAKTPEMLQRPTVALMGDGTPLRRPHSSLLGLQKNRKQWLVN